MYKRQESCDVQSVAIVPSGCVNMAVSCPCFSCGWVDGFLIVFFQLVKTWRVNWYSNVPFSGLNKRLFNMSRLLASSTCRRPSHRKSHLYQPTGLPSSRPTSQPTSLLTSQTVQHYIFTEITSISNQQKSPVQQSSYIFVPPGTAASHPILSWDYETNFVF